MEGELAPRDPSVKLFAAIDDYLQAKKATANSERTIEFDRERLEIVKRHLGDVKLSTITRNVIEGFQAKRRLEGCQQSDDQHGCRSAASGAQAVQAMASARGRREDADRGWRRSRRPRAHA